TGCDVDDGCRLEATGTRSPWRPRAEEAGIATAQGTGRAHAAGPGWADEASSSAPVGVDVNAPSLLGNVDGDHRDAHGARGPSITLDRRSPTQTINQGTWRRVTFSIDADSSPETLTIEQGLSLEGPE